MVITFPTFISVVVTHQDCVLRLTYVGQGRAEQRHSYAQMLRNVDRIKQNRDQDQSTRRKKIRLGFFVK